MKLYLEVTQDEKSLPLAVAKSPSELARIRGASLLTIRNHIHKAKHGKLKNYPRYIVVDVDEKE